MRKKTITLGPTLVVLVGPAAAGKSTFAKQFPKNEVVSTDGLREHFTGDFRRQDADDVVMAEFGRRIQIRLEAGLRVVADATHIRDNDRRRTGRLAAKYGARLIYVVINRPLITKMNHAEWRAGVRVKGKELVVAHDETFVANEGKILNGDGLGALVIDARKEVPAIVMPLARDPYQSWPVEQAPLADLYSRGYKGILVIGDVHGNVAGLQKMIQYARENGLFLLSMGDIVDYDPDTLRAADIMATAIFRGEAAAIFGNHERKILRFVITERVEGIFATDNPGFRGDLHESNTVTINQLKAMLPEDRLKWETRFIGMCGLMPHAYRMPQYFFVHGAASPRMLDSTEFRFGEDTPEESMACFGQTTGKLVRGFPERIYDWCQTVPARHTVVVGHDCRCETYPLIAAGKAGGRAIFLDTGSSKPDRFPDGRLSGMVLEIENKKKVGFVLENEKFISEHDL